jgi:hypothetical protein
LLALCCSYGLRIAEARFPAVRPVGLALLAATVLVVLGYVVKDTWFAGVVGDIYTWVRASLRVVEYLLVLIVAWWIISMIPFLVWLVLGQCLACQGTAARASVATGRLGLFVSMASFLIVTMALWASLTHVVEFAAANTSYCPAIFKVGACLATSTGKLFLEDRYTKSISSFALIAGLMLSLAVYLVIVLVPSVLAEIKVAIGTSQTLGRWLTAGYRRLDAVVTGLAAVSVLLAIGVGSLFLCARFGYSPGGHIGEWVEHVGTLSEGALKPLVFGAAGGAAALTAFGSLLSRYVPWLRLPLDIALDVDNHFREFPRRAIPRVRIVSRYVALFEHLVAQDYDRIVIVAHSQGTVITADLLRYLKYRGENDKDGRISTLWKRLDGKLAVLTAGCPLRQLYAARFPYLYEWVPGGHGGRSGPLASDIGVRRWINVYATGDYVGRWLWCDPPPAVDVVHGKPTLYDIASLKIPITEEWDVCLGSGAHTHYFDPSQRIVAQNIDSLVSDALPGSVPGAKATASPM